jgi:predicted nucleic acid-binding protein
MTGRFFDSKVLLYLASADEAKAARVETLVGAGGVISVQVLNEIGNVARGKQMRLTWPETHEFLGLLSGLLSIVPVSFEIHKIGLRLAERYGFSIYDAMIVAAALLSDCGTLWSEDMQDGLLVEGKLRIVNPFNLDERHIATIEISTAPGRILNSDMRRDGPDAGRHTCVGSRPSEQKESLGLVAELQGEWFGQGLNMAVRPLADGALPFSLEMNATKEKFDC